MTEVVANSYDFITHLPLKVGSGIKQIVDHAKDIQQLKAFAQKMYKLNKAKSVQAFVSFDDSGRVLKGSRPFIGPIKSVTGRNGDSFYDHPSQRHDFVLNTVKKGAYAKKTLIKAVDLKAMAKKINKAKTVGLKDMLAMEKKIWMSAPGENAKLREQIKEKAPVKSLEIKRNEVTAEFLNHFYNIEVKVNNPKLSQEAKDNTPALSTSSRLLTIMQTIDHGIKNLSSGLYDLVKLLARWIYQWRHPETTFLYPGQYN